MHRHPPIKRLEFSLEDQIYRALRKARIITNIAVNSLFSVPANQEFVFVETGIEVRLRRSFVLAANVKKKLTFSWLSFCLFIDFGVTSLILVATLENSIRSAFVGYWLCFNVKLNIYFFI